MDPKDTATHILKGLALDLQEFKTSVLDSLDTALSPLCEKSLTGKDRGDAFFKRAELKMAMAAKARRGGEKRVDLAVDDLNEAVSLRPDLGHNGARQSWPPSWRGFGDFFGGNGGLVLEFLWVFELKFML